MMSEILTLYTYLNNEYVLSIQQYTGCASNEVIIAVSIFYVVAILGNGIATLQNVWHSLNKVIIITFYKVCVVKQFVRD